MPNYYSKLMGDFNQSLELMTRKIDACRGWADKDLEPFGFDALNTIKTNIDGLQLSWSLCWDYLNSLKVEDNPNMSQEDLEKAQDRNFKELGQELGEMVAQVKEVKEALNAMSDSENVNLAGKEDLYYFAEDILALKSHYDAMEARINEQKEAEELEKTGKDLAAKREVLREKYPELMVDYKIPEFTEKINACRDMDDETVKRDYPDVYDFRQYMKEEQAYSAHFADAEKRLDQKKREQVVSVMDKLDDFVNIHIVKQQNENMPEDSRYESMIEDLQEIKSIKDKNGEVDLGRMADKLHRLYEKTGEYVKDFIKVNKGKNIKELPESATSGYKMAHALNVYLGTAAVQTDFLAKKNPYDRKLEIWETLPSDSMSVESALKHFQNDGRQKATFDEIDKQTNMMSQLNLPVRNKDMEALLTGVVKKNTRETLQTQYKQLTDSVARFADPHRKLSEKEKDKCWEEIGKNLKAVEKLPEALEHSLKKGNFALMKTNRGRSQYAISQSIRMLKNHYDFMSRRMETEHVLKECRQFMKDREPIINHLKDMIKKAGKLNALKEQYGVTQLKENLRNPEFVKKELGDLLKNPEFVEGIRNFNELDSKYHVKVMEKVQPQQWQRDQIRSVWEQVNEFYSHKDDGKTRSSNSKEYNAMIKSMKEFIDTNPDKVDYEDFKKGLADLNNKVNQYIDAKEKQFHPFSTVQGSTRMAFAKCLNRCLEVASRENQCLDHQIQQVEKTVGNFNKAYEKNPSPLTPEELISTGFGQLSRETKQPAVQQEHVSEAAQHEAPKKTEPLLGGPGI
ncbi:MAG: hypothetical protein PUB10_08365 [Clostridiales bacterium]|nr:hypothetical protein [Clostridiales bacterium]